MAHWEFPTEPAFGYEDIVLNASTGAAKGLNPPHNPNTGEPVRNAFVQCQRATARIRLDGGNPTASSGFMLVAGDGMILTGDRVRQARFASDTNTAPTLSVHYFE